MRLVGRPLPEPPRGRSSTLERDTLNYLGRPRIRGKIPGAVSNPLPTLQIRPATGADAAAIAAIYNDAVATTVATFDTESRTEEAQLRWLRDHAPPLLVLVAGSSTGVVGWASLSRWSDRPAYAETAEVSVYVDARRRGTGVGRALLGRLVAEAERAGFHTLLARVADGNAVSLRLHLSQGFQTVGVMREVGWKFGRRIDVHLLQRLLGVPRAGGDRAAGPDAVGAQS